MIDLINIGITGQELVDKINEIIAVVNGLDNVTDYEQLANKPTINGVPISGEVEIQQLNITAADINGLAQHLETMATKSEMQAAVNGAITTAQTNAAALVAGKMDANPEDTLETTMIGTDAFVYVNSSEGVRKVKVSTLADNVALKMVTKDSYDSAVTKQKRIIALKGDQNGNNVDYVCDDGFVVGTSDLYLNGQRLVRGTDYLESTAYSVTMLTQVPISTDRMVFVAVPLSI